VDVTLGAVVAVGEVTALVVDFNIPPFHVTV
jgi:hypothetical protein